MFRSFAEQSSDIIVLADTRGAVLYENPAMEKILGYKVEERIGSSGFELIHPDDMKIVTDAADILFNDTNAPVIKMNFGCVIKTEAGGYSMERQATWCMITLWKPWSSTCMTSLSARTPKIT